MTQELALALVVPLCFLGAALWGVSLGARRVVVVWVACLGAAHTAAVALSYLALRTGDAVAHVSSQSLFGLGFAALVLLAASYPDRTLPPAPVGAGLGVVLGLPLVGGLAGPSPPVLQLGDGSDRLGPVVALLPEELATVGAAILLLPVLAIVVFVVRYARAGPDTRRRMRWPVLGFALLTAVALAGVTLQSSLGAVADALFVAAAPAVPVGLVLGATDHPVLDADRAARRTAVFGGPWLVLAAAFGIGASGSAWAASSRSLVATLLMGAVISVMLAAPVRRRLLDLADDRVRLAADLAASAAEVEASRSRLATAADAERRRLERDLHDGLQQELLALMAQLEVARASASADARTRALGAAGELAHSAYESLRELSQGLRPAILEDLGLVEAARARAQRTVVATTVEADPLPRLAPEVEGAAYFVVSEALANVGKHSRASSAVVRLTAGQDRLLVEVVDDGGGRIDPMGSGIRGLRDRCAALGGELSVGTHDGRTRLTATLPLTGAGR